METVTLQKENKTQVAKARTPFFKPAIQKKLSVGSANDSYEVEADNMANKVMRSPSPKGEQMTHAGALVQRKCAACEEEKIQKKPLAESITPLIQRSSPASESGGNAPSHVESQINSSKGGGNSMGHGTKNFMESRFGTDFSDVKIHTGSQAVQMSRELNAQAFTVGNDIYFNQGKYSPNSNSGKHLLAHELTHTVQQKGGIGRKIQKLDHVADTGFRYSPPAAIARSIIEIQAVVGTNPDGVYGTNTKIAVERYQRKLTAIGFYSNTIDGKWGGDTDVAHEAFATGPNVERLGYNCAGFAFKRYTFIGLPATRSIYSGMNSLSNCNDACSPWHHKFWMWEFDIFTEDTRTRRRSRSSRDFHTVGGQTDGVGAGPSQVMSKDGARPIIGPGTPMSFRPLLRERVVQNDGSRHPFLVWHVSNIDQKCFSNENLP